MPQKANLLSASWRGACSQEAWHCFGLGVTPHWCKKNLFKTAESWPSRRKCDSVIPNSEDQNQTLPWVRGVEFNIKKPVEADKVRSFRTCRDEKLPPSSPTLIIHESNLQFFFNINQLISTCIWDTFKKYGHCVCICQSDLKLEDKTRQ